MDTYTGYLNVKLEPTPTPTLTPTPTPTPTPTLTPELEDYTTFKEIDPNDHLAVSSNRLSFEAHRNEDCYLYKDYGEGFFGNFVHEVDLKVTSADKGCEGAVWMLSNYVDDVWGIALHGEPAIGVDFTTGYIYLWERKNSELYWDFFLFTPNKPYYLTIKKIGTSLTCEVYSDSARTNILKTLSLTLHADYKFRYLFGASTFNDGKSYVCTIDIENLKIIPISTPTPTPPPHITGECLFPRIITGTLTPRLDTGIIFYRVRCIIDKWV